MIYVLEGLDASGKATQTALLVEHYKTHRDGHSNAQSFSFPNYSSFTGRGVLSHLKSVWKAVFMSYEATKRDNNPFFDELAGSEHKLNEFVFQCVQTVDKYALGADIKPFEANPLNHAICDRYDISARAYGAAGGVDPVWLEQIHKCLPEPAIRIYLDIPFEESIRRRPERRDRIESDFEYLKKVRDEYLRIFREEGSADPARWRILDGSNSIEEVHTDILDAINRAG